MCDQHNKQSTRFSLCVNLHASCCRLCRALARVDYTPPQSWLRQFAALSRPRLRALRYRGQVEMIWAMACWDCPLDRPWLFEFLRVSSARMDEEYKPQQLAITLSALAKLNCKVPNAWLAQALQVGHSSHKFRQSQCSCSTA